MRAVRFGLMQLAHHLIGPDHTQLLWWQELVRAGIIFVVGIVLIRASGLRTFSRYSPLDTIVAVVIGSNLSRAMTGSAPFLPTLTASLLIVAAHRLIAIACMHSKALGALVKGNAKPLIIAGQLDAAVLRKESITHDDLMEAIRLRGGVDLGDVSHASLERNGKISLRLKVPSV